jgi:hypothetical protein
VLDEPWASAIAHGLKKLETRSLPPAGNGALGSILGARRYPGLALNIGDRIAIVSAASRSTTYKMCLGSGGPREWWSPPGRFGPTWRLRRRSMIRNTRRVYDDLALVDPSVAPASVHKLAPPGSVVCTAVFQGAMPIRTALSTGGYMLTLPGPGRLVGMHDGYEVSDHSLELPWGDYREGRWAWGLSAVTRSRLPVTRCPGCRPSGHFHQGVWRLPLTERAHQEFTKAAD